MLTAEEDDGGDHADAEADSSGGRARCGQRCDRAVAEDDTHDFTTRSATMHPEAAVASVGARAKVAYERRVRSSDRGGRVFGIR